LRLNPQAALSRHNSIMSTTNAVVVIGVNPHVMSTAKSALVGAGYAAESSIVFSLEDAQAALQKKPKILVYGPGLCRCSADWIDACDAMVKASTPATKVGDW
jgi:hypothetical protein